MTQPSLHELIRRAAAANRAAEAEDRLAAVEAKAQASLGAGFGTPGEAALSGAGAIPGVGAMSGVEGEIPGVGVGDDFSIPGAGRGVPGHLRPRWARARIGPGKRGRVLRWFWAAAARGEWVVGERLPGERKVAAALGVSRDTVRAAMHELAAAGVVERGSRGQGWRVREVGSRKCEV